MENKLQLKKLMFKTLRMATWSIKEAAFLVNGLHPNYHSIELNAESDDPVSRTYYWLRKEEGKGRLFKILEQDGVARYSPGTLMRHLTNSGRYVNKSIWNQYDVLNGCPPGQHVSQEAKAIYLAAAKVIWTLWPDRPAATVAADLFELHTFYKREHLPLVSHETIRGWLRTIKSGNKGRPRKIVADQHVDLKEIVAKIPE
jgi:hypothetical protein